MLKFWKVVLGNLERSYPIDKPYYNCLTIRCMANRRRVLIGLGSIGIGALAGCSSDSPEDSSSGVTEPTTQEATTTTEETTAEETESTTTEETTTEEPEPANFEFTSSTPQNEEFSGEDQISIEAQFQNTGEVAGTKMVEVRIGGETIDEAEFELDPGETDTAGLNYVASELEAGTWRYSFHSPDDSISAEFTIAEPEIQQPETQSFSGSGQTVEEDINISGGLTVIEATHDGDSNFQVTLQGDSEFGTNLINVIGSFDGAQAELVESGTYLLEINADGNWEVDVKQPRSNSGDSLPQTLSGQGPDVLGPFDFSGTHIATGSHSGSSNFQVQVYPMEGLFGEVVFNEIGEFEGETTFSHNGIGWVDVNADGEWSLELE